MSQSRAGKRRILGLPPHSVGIPLSRAIEKGGILSIAGIVPMDDMGEIHGSLEEQTHNILGRFRVLVKEAGGGMDDIVSVRVYISRPEDYAPMNDVYGTYFIEPYPARSCVVVGFVNPACRVVMEAVAILG